MWLFLLTRAVIPGGKSAYEPRQFDDFLVTELCSAFPLRLEITDPVTDHRVGGYWLILGGAVYEVIDLFLGFVEGFVIDLVELN